LADDHTIMRNGLRMLLEAEADLHVVSEAGSIQTVFAAFMRQAHDAGASGYVLKDAAPTDLVRTIRMAMGSPAAD
jgi:DNA-binding NarL/FixJ family response regulator